MTRPTQRSNKNNHDYIPGVCNIGAEERLARRRAGILFTIATVLIFLTLTLTDAPIYWSLLLFLPAAIAASGFLQDRLHFCAAYGLKGLYNVVNSMGQTDNVDLEEYRKKDRNKAFAIVGASVLTGVAVTCFSMLLT